MRTFRKYKCHQGILSFTLSYSVEQAVNEEDRELITPALPYSL